MKRNLLKLLNSFAMRSVSERRDAAIPALYADIFRIYCAVLSVRPGLFRLPRQFTEQLVF